VPAPAAAPAPAVRPSPFGGTVGERPPGPFGGLPISEFGILVGGIGLVAGLLSGNGVALTVGAVVCGLGVLEVTAREHFSGYRSHAALLAAFPAVGAEFGVALFVGQSARRALLIVVVPVFAVCFWALRRWFVAARQARLARPPEP